MTNVFASAATRKSIGGNRGNRCQAPLSLFAFGALADADGGGVEAEAFSELVDQKALSGKVKRFLATREDDKGRGL